MTLHLRSAAVTDRGLIRSGNQDCVHAGPRLLAVADGMGGMAAGEVASRFAIEAVAPLDTPIPDEEQVAALRAAVDAANARIAEAVAADPARQGMGTTLTALRFSGTQTALAHVGDSRAYLLRDARLSQVTRDDTYVQMLVDQGVITADQAAGHPRRAVVTQALQGEPVDPSYTVGVPKAGDRWLLCTDGLSTVVSAATIEQAMRDYAALPDLAARLLDLALRAGGPDNITVVVADVTQ
ncbi:MAG TPA: protein phosphatase 2C domain-containing protein [Catenuloplanes sp.]